MDGRREEESSIRAEGENGQGGRDGAGNVVTEGLGNKFDTQNQDTDAMHGDTSAKNSFITAGMYREIGIRNPPDVEERGETYSGTYLNAQGKIELVTFSPWMDTGGEMLFCYTLNEDGVSWDRQPILWTEGLKGKMQQNRITVLFGEDQNYYAYYCDEGQLYHMVRKEEDSFVEIVIKDWDKSEVHKYPVIPGEVAVLQCGNIVMVDTVGNCFIYSPDGSKILASFRCGWCETICVTGNDIFVLDHENTSILRYDGKNMKMLPSFAGDFTSIVRLSVFGDTLFVCSPEGIFSAELKEEENLTSEEIRLTKWLDSGKFHFSKENGYPLNLFSLGDTFYIVYAEQWGKVKKYVKRKEGEEFLDTLTVYSLENSELVIDMIAEFIMKYPEIDVHYETGEGTQGSTMISDHIRALNTRILAGDGPDILILDGLPAQSYVKKGILVDLSTALYGVLGELQENIVSNYRQGNRIYMLPMRYMIPMIATSGQNAQIFSSLSDLVTYCEEGEGNKVIMPGVPYSYIIELLYYNFPPKIVSEDGSVNKDNLLEFIRLAKRFCEAEGAVASEEVAGSAFKFRAGVRKRGYFDGNTLSSYGYGEQVISFINMTGIYELSTYPELVESCGGALLGNKGMFFPNGVIGVNAYAKQKNLAYRFIEAVFSYEMQRIHSSNAGFSLYGKVLSEDATV
ncbi:MAG: extracellular solute-binding protein, partial [Lachnospiraceae bacterium]|nr:extracellular solute-binding protein [Lachnospiraceae bacterium]